MAFAPTPLSFHHHPLMVDLDLSHHLATQCRQEWEYSQHLMHLRQQQAVAEESRQLVEACAAAAAAKEFERRLLFEQEQLRRQAQLQQARLQYQYQQEQQRARRRRQQQQQQQRAFARQSAEWRRLSHVLDSLAAPETITRLLQHHPAVGGAEQDDDGEEEGQEAVVVPSPAEIFFELYGEPERHRDDYNIDEEVVLRHKQPSSASAPAADPEEVDLAAAAFAAAAAEEEEEDTHTAAEEEDASSEADSTDSDMAETSASTPTDDNEARTTAALDALAKLAQDFTARRRAFVTPAALSFQPAPVSIPSSTSRSPTPPLAFESNNTPFLGYEDFLVSLLSRIDAVESLGIGEVKMARKNLVREVERELARLDDLKDQAWERLSTSSTTTTTSSGEEEAGSASEASSDDDEDFEMMTSEAVEGLPLSDDDEMTASPSPTDDVLDDVLDSADDEDEDDDDDDDDDDEDASEVHHVKVPFAVRPRSSSRVANRPKVHFARHSPASGRDDSPPALSEATAEEDHDADDEEVADILLQVQRLGEQVAQLEEAERDQQEMRHLIDSDSPSNADSDREVDGEEEMFVVYF